ncbi:MAG: hypothetical protein ACRD4Q_03150 [Candidatus Acidiferrales bacterium]
MSRNATAEAWRNLQGNAGSSKNQDAMITDRPPRNAQLLAQFLHSDRRGELEVPQDKRLRLRAQAIETAMAGGKQAAVLHACTEFVAVASEFYLVQKPAMRVLAARPLRIRESGWSTELFGDYSPETLVIRIWARTAIRKQVTSFGTFLSTLCHEFCHHLDIRRFGFPDSPHTRGFYERTAALYHHSRGTPVKKLIWLQLPRGRWRIDWRRMNRNISA